MKKTSEITIDDEDIVITPPWWDECLPGRYLEVSPEYVVCNAVCWESKNDGLCDTIYLPKKALLFVVDKRNVRDGTEISGDILCLWGDRRVVVPVFSESKEVVLLPEKFYSSKKFQLQ